MNMLNNLNLLTSLTQHLLEHGLDYEVTLHGSGTDVTIIDTLTNDELVSTSGEDVERALFKGLAIIASRAKKEDMLSYL